MHRAKLVVAGLLVASPTVADDMGMTAGGGAGVGGEGAVAVQATSLVKRPYVLGEGKIGFYAAYEIERSSHDVMGMTETELKDAFLVGAGYGLTKEATLGAEYAFTPGILSDFDSELSGGLGLWGMYQVINDGTLNVTVTGELVYDLCGTKDMAMECVGTKGLTLGAGVRYLLSPEFALFSGAPIGPGPVGQQFKISLEDMGKAFFDLPAGVMYQATPDLGLYVATNLMHINIANDDSGFFAADFIPVTVGGSFELDRSMSIQGELGLGDISDGVDALTFAVGFRYYN